MSRDIRFSFSCFLFLLVTFFYGCGDRKPSPSSTTVAPSKIEDFTPPPKVEISKYYYRGEKFQDPFIPLTASARALVPSEIVIPNVHALTLKGIFVADGEKIAIVSGGGHSYMIRSNKLYDIRNRVIPGFYCRIKTESVTIKTGDVSREIKLRE